MHTHYPYSSKSRRGPALSKDRSCSQPRSLRPACSLTCWFHRAFARSSDKDRCAAASKLEVHRHRTVGCLCPSDFKKWSLVLDLTPQLAASAETPGLHQVIRLAHSGSSSDGG